MDLLAYLWTEEKPPSSWKISNDDGDFSRPSRHRDTPLVHRCVPRCLAVGHAVPRLVLGGSDAKTRVFLVPEGAILQGISSSFPWYANLREIRAATHLFRAFSGRSLTCGDTSDGVRSVDRKTRILGVNDHAGAYKAALRIEQGKLYLVR